ncbi:hypothetical protein [Luteimonas sp. MC1895]|uniref:hypothetical protein n=1 Tax=Luteimonas sp. MC1895 TaxID=2819513 RepID=UPI0018F0C9EC|nr:hypothetical protein [Luteimonas sp. MC1895]
MDATRARRILALLRADDVDAAIAARLPAFAPLPGLTADENRALADARERLLAAWAARERHRARAERLERIAQARARARETRQVAPAADVAAPDGAGVAAPDGASVASPAAPSLPPAAAAALARARARVAGGQA